MVGDSKGERLVAFWCFLVSYHPSEKGIWDFHSSHATELPRKNFSSATMNHGGIVNLASLWGEERTYCSTTGVVANIGTPLEMNMTFFPGPEIHCLYKKTRRVILHGQVSARKFWHGMMEWPYGRSTFNLPSKWSFWECGRPCCTSFTWWGCFWRIWKSMQPTRTGEFLRDNLTLPKWFFQDDFTIDIGVILNTGTANDHDAVGDTSI